MPRPLIQAPRNKQFRQISPSLTLGSGRGNVRKRSAFCWLSALFLSVGLPAAAQQYEAVPAGFERSVLEDNFRGGYGVKIADIDGDGLQDIVALAISPAQLVWYRNPNWTRHTIETGTENNIDVAAHDIDGDGDLDLALASSFALQRSSEGGLVHWLENPADSSDPAAAEWDRHYIDAVPTSHRLKWGDVNGDGRKDLLNLPIIGIGAEPPRYEVDLHLKAYPIPPDPRVDTWASVTLDDSLQMAHGLAVIDWDGDAREDLLTASFDGVELLRLASRGRIVDSQLLGEGHAGSRPEQGSSDVAMGTLGDDSERFVAAIEPWHGNEVVVYRPGAGGNLPWEREVIESDLATGHALLVRDLNNDGHDEIVAGNRSRPHNLFIYRYDETTEQWQRLHLDSGGVAVSGLAAADLNGDGFIDIVAVGSTGTANVVLYENPGDL